MKIGDIFKIKANTFVWVNGKVSSFSFIKRIFIAEDTIVFIVDDVSDKKNKIFMNNMPGHIYQVLDAHGMLLYVKRSQLNHIK
jgi:hypothetical protein